MKYRRPRGLTILELAAVMFALALIAAAATLLSISQLEVSADSINVMNQLKHVEWAARDHAVRTGSSVQLLYDLEHGRVEMIQSSTGAALRAPYHLPSRFRMTELRQRARTGKSSPESINKGSVRLECSALGFTPTYAVRISTPRSDDSWILFTGLTGHAIELDNATQIQAILGSEDGEWHDPR